MIGRSTGSADSHARRTSRVRRFVTILGMALAACATADGDSYPRQPGVDARHYAFKLALRDDADEIEGEATVGVRFNADVPELALDLASAKAGRGMTVGSVTSGGVAAGFRHEGDRLRIAVAPAARAGESREFAIRYRGVPRSGLRVGANKFGERTFFSDNWPDEARQWLPMIDHPSDKATSEFVVTAPGRYQVVSNGVLVASTDLGDGRRTTHWREDVPIASWLNALGVARFSVRHAGAVRGVPVEVWSFHQDADRGRVAFEGPAKRALDFYMETFGPFPYEKLGNVEAAGVAGGMELASAIFYGEGSVTGKPEDELVAHEVAHQWFGDSVTERDWDDVWLSEGFASYGALLFVEHDRGRDAFVEGLRRERGVVLEFEAKNPGLAVVHRGLDDMKKVLNPLVYRKGSWTLHMLRRRVGDEMFRAGLRAYYRRYRDANASTDDFRRVMEEVSGQDLAWFFRQWLDRPGSPVVEGGWRYDVSAKVVEVTLAQVQAGEAYRLPMEVGITEAGRAGMRVERAELTGKSHRFTYASDSEPTTVVLDPGTWVLMGSRFGRR